MIRSALIPAVAAVLTASPSQAPDAAEQLRRLPVENVARMLMPAAEAERIVRFDARTLHAMAPPPRRSDLEAEVDLYTGASATGRNICVRTRYTAVAQRPSPDADTFTAKRDPIPIAQIRWDADCSASAPEVFASVNPGVEVAEASALLARVATFRDAAATGRSATVRVECVSEVQGFECPADPREALARLPVETTHLTGRGHGPEGQLYLAMNESTLGQAFWDVRITDGAQPTLRLVRKMPAPF